MNLWLFLLPLSAAAQVLDVTIVDYAGVPPATLTAAREVLARIYRQTGSRVESTVKAREWREGEYTRLADVPGDIVLRICSKEMAKRLVRRETVLGYVQPSGDGELPRVATVLYQRVEDLRDATNALTAEVLGAALSHELGHLLLGKGAHAPTGLMRCPWNAEDLRALSRGRLIFDQRQSKSIAPGILSRKSKRSETPHWSAIVYP